MYKLYFVICTSHREVKAYRCKHLIDRREKHWCDVIIHVKSRARLQTMLAMCVHICGDNNSSGIEGFVLWVLETTTRETLVRLVAYVHRGRKRKREKERKTCDSYRERKDAINAWMPLKSRFVSFSVALCFFLSVLSLRFFLSLPLTFKPSYMNDITRRKLYLPHDFCLARCVLFFPIHWFNTLFHARDYSFHLRLLRVKFFNQFVRRMNEIWLYIGDTHVDILYFITILYIESSSSEFLDIWFYFRFFRNWRSAILFLFQKHKRYNSN